jgi:hypothetical protein
VQQSKGLILGFYKHNTYSFRYFDEAGAATFLSSIEQEMAKIPSYRAEGRNYVVKVDGLTFLFNETVMGRKRLIVSWNGHTSMWSERELISLINQFK